MGDISSIGSGLVALVTGGERIAEQNQDNARIGANLAEERHVEAPKCPTENASKRHASQSPGRDVLSNIQASRNVSAPSKASKASTEENTITKREILETAEQVIGQTFNLEA